MNFDWSASNYKVINIFKIFPTISQSLHKDKYEMIMIAKKFETYVF
jgi:hypothetical protein